MQRTRAREKRWKADHQPSGSDTHVVVAGGEHTHYEFVTHLLTDGPQIWIFFLSCVPNLDAIFPDLAHQRIRYVFHVCELRDHPSQTRLIEFEGIENVEDLANYTDTKLENMADRNSKRTPVASHVQMRLQRTNTLKVITHWVRKRICEGVECDLHLLNQDLIAELIMEINAAAGKKDADSKLYYPDAFLTTNYKNWIKKVENYLNY